MAKYLLTGGAGFIGSHVAKKLLAEGDEVIIYDAYRHWVPIDKSLWPSYQDYRLKNLGNSVTKEFGDITDRGRFEEVLEKHKPDVVIHLAALAVADVSNKYPSEARINIEQGTLTVLDAIKSFNSRGGKIKRFVYISSSMVYGNFKQDNEGNPIPAKEDDLLNPIDLYGCYKVTGELITRVYGKNFGIPCTIIRPSAVYGPTDANRRVTEIFVNNALLGKPLVLENGGLSQLDFTYVEDIAGGIVLAAKSDKAIGHTFNLTRGEGRTIKEMANIISKLIPGTKIIEKEAMVYRPERGALNISKAKKLLGYEPKHSLEDGMKKYVEFVKSHGAFERLRE